MEVEGLAYRLSVLARVLKVIPSYRTELEAKGAFPSHVPGILLPSGLSLVVGLVLYISSINDEVMNRPSSSEQYFHYRYGWSFAFAASSFLLKEVMCWGPEDPFEGGGGGIWVFQFLGGGGLK